MQKLTGDMQPYERIYDEPRYRNKEKNDQHRHTGTPEHVKCSMFLLSKFGADVFLDKDFKYVSRNF